MTFKLTLILLTLSTPVMGATPFSQPTQTMLYSLAAQNYAAARQQSNLLPAQDAILALTPAAVRNNTNAQWMLAQAYWKAGDKQHAGYWGYTARMGTILDAAVCLERDAKNADTSLAYPYRDILNHVRSDPLLEQEAVRFAGQHFSKSFYYYQDPLWTCRTWAQSLGRETKYSNAHPEKEWNEIRLRSLEILLRKSGLPQLIPKMPTKKNDPFKQNFGEAWFND